MGSDARDGEGNDIDKRRRRPRSDTTILLHLSADRKRAYGVSIPRDSMVDRPDCKDDDGETIPGGDRRDVERGLLRRRPGVHDPAVRAAHRHPVDHFVVVDFNGFRDMVDAIGGVEVCIPEDDRRPGPRHLPRGRHPRVQRREALNYVRERYVVGDGSDIGRMKRQQAFIAVDGRTGDLGRHPGPARPARAASSTPPPSRSVDDGLGSLGEDRPSSACEFQSIGLDNIQFVTVPSVRPADPNRLVWTPEAKQVWEMIADDEPLHQAAQRRRRSAPAHVPGSATTPSDRRARAARRPDAEHRGRAAADGRRQPTPPRRPQRRRASTGLRVTSRRRTRPPARVRSAAAGWPRSSATCSPRQTSDERDARAREPGEAGATTGSAHQVPPHHG